MEKNLLDRISDLEKEVRSFKAELTPLRKRDRFLVRLRKAVLFVVSYWLLFSFLAGLLIALYVKYEFDIDYFESYRNTSKVKRMAEVYRELGDRMMLINEWKAAEDAYQSAVKIDPKNMKATFGVIKAKVFQPMEGQKFYAPEVADAKLTSLLSLFPDDYEIFFLKGVRSLHQGDYEQARSWYEKSIQKNPNFIGGYIGLGFINSHGFNLEESVRNYKKALELDPNFSLANNNLGFCYSRQMKFKEAIVHLQKANSVSSSLGTTYNLGDSYLYSGDLNASRTHYEKALKVLHLPKAEIENERYLGGEYIINYMPLNAGDVETSKKFVKVSNLDQKKAVLHYSMSFNHALLKDFDMANREFKKGFHLDNRREVKEFLVNKILSIEHFLKLDGRMKNWFEDRRKELVAGAYAPGKRVS